LSNNDEKPLSLPATVSSVEMYSSLLAWYLF